MKLSEARRDWLFPSCQVHGHDWQLLGGCNAGCMDYCSCSVPVHTCRRCGDCDYGENDEARQVILNCDTERRCVLRRSRRSSRQGVRMGEARARIGF